MKKLIISLELILLILFLGYRNAEAYISGMGPMVYMHIYNEEMVLEDTKTISINVAKETFDIPSKENYQFDGWYSDKKMTKKIKNNSLKNFSYDEMDNMHIYGKWVKKESEFHHILFGSIICIITLILIVVYLISYKKFKKIINRVNP